MGYESIEDVLRARSKAEIVSTHIFELLPEFVRNQGDPLGVLKTLLGAVQEEYNRSRDSISEVLTLIDPLGINNRFIIEGVPAFTSPSQFLQFTETTNGPPPTITFKDPAVSSNDFYNGAGVFIFGTGDSSIDNQYRIISDYDGASKMAFLDTKWKAVTSSGGWAVICFRDRIYLPTTIVADPRRADGTVLPEQVDKTGAALADNQIKLPSNSYISDRDDYYNGWIIEFIDGESKGMRYHIDDYVGAASSASNLLYTCTVKEHFGSKSPKKGDWFKLVPPSESAQTVSDDYYKDRYVRIISGPSDQSAGYRFTVQTRRIIKSRYDPLAVPATNVAYVYDPQTGEGEPFDYPPDPTSYFGISNHFVSLAHLARQVGFQLDALDPEELQREQIREAFNFYRLKGTKRAVELICRSFGLIPTIQETSSNYTHEPPKVEVGPDRCVPTHSQYPWEEVTPFVESGDGEDGVPCSWHNEKRDSVRIPDSDIKIYLQRYHPKVLFSGELLSRIIEKIDDVRPIHVEIILIGFLESVNEKVDVVEDVQMSGVFTLPETVNVFEGFFVTPVDSVLLSLGKEVIAVEPFLLIKTFARYSVKGDRYDGVDGPKLRWGLGKVYHQGA